MERRRTKRFNCEIQVSWRNGEECAQGATFDICSRGAFVRSRKMVPVNSIVDFEIDPGQGKERILCRAQVVWVNKGQLEGYPPGFGIEFVDGGEQLEGIALELADNNAEGY